MLEEIGPEKVGEASERDQEMMQILPEQRGRDFLEGKKDLMNKLNAGTAMVVVGAMATAGLLVTGTIEATVLTSAFDKYPPSQWCLGISGTAQMIASVLGMGMTLKGLKMQTEAHREENLPEGEK